jgi:hypothetical protein
MFAGRVCDLNAGPLRGDDASRNAGETRRRTCVNPNDDV